MVDIERVVRLKFVEKDIRFIHDCFVYTEHLGFQMYIEKNENIVSKLSERM